jgi:hypothetical protein
LFAATHAGPDNPIEENSTMADPRLEVLTPQNSQIIFIDHQPQMAFGVQSIDRQVLKNNTVALAKAAKNFTIPTTITTSRPRVSPAMPIRRCSTCSPT